jgi:hypothetical protein
MARAMAILAVCFCGLMHAQSAINAPQFEVASIKPRRFQRWIFFVGN